MNEWPFEARLSALSPLDGRYADQCAGLRELFSEASLIRHRLRVEILYLTALLPFLRLGELGSLDCQGLLAWSESLGHADLERLKALETRTRHDLKAIELLLREHVQKTPIAWCSPWIHWGLTSEDVDNLAYGLMLKQASELVIVPAELALLRLVLRMALEYAAVVMPARTHGQVAVPTTLGKELAVVASRAAYFLEKLRSHRFGGKLNGAVGNFNAQTLLFPDRDWIGFSQQFVASLGLEPTPVTTQIEPATRLVHFLDLLRQLNNVWLGLARDLWLYASLGHVRQKAVSGEVGSSTMPHKVNPIHFENAEGNLQTANALLSFLSDKLALSRLQRDLSDKTVKRNLGVAFGHGLVAVSSLSDGLDCIAPDEPRLRHEVSAHHEVMAEAVQLLLRARGDEQAFATVQDRVRGSEEPWPQLMEALPMDIRATVASWRPEEYVGLAKELTLREVGHIREVFPDIECPPAETS